MESGNLGVVAFKVREVKVIGECLLLPGEPEKKEKRGLHPALNTDPDRFYSPGSLSYLPSRKRLFDKSVEGST